jgi:hypothetical protein
MPEHVDVRLRYTVIISGEGLLIVPWYLEQAYVSSGLVHVLPQGDVSATVASFFMPQFNYRIAVNNAKRDDILKRSASQALQKLLPNHAFDVRVQDTVTAYKDYEIAEGYFDLACIALPTVPTFR